MDPHPRKWSPRSNAERQRLFRLRHPGYFRKYEALRRASKERAEKQVALILAHTAALNRAALAAQSAPARALPAPLTIPDLFPPMRLALPAPVNLELILPALNRTLTPQRAPVPVERPKAA